MTRSSSHAFARFVTYAGVLSETCRRTTVGERSTIRFDACSKRERDGDVTSFAVVVSRKYRSFGAVPVLLLDTKTS